MCATNLSLFKKSKLLYMKWNTGWYFLLHFMATAFNSYSIDTYMYGVLNLLAIHSPKDLDVPQKLNPQQTNNNIFTPILQIKKPKQGEIE